MKKTPNMLAFFVVTVSLFRFSAGGDCWRGWTFYGDSCYLYMDDEYSWFDAQEACNVLGGHLVEIRSATENTYLLNMAASHGDHDIWIGLEDLAIENEFVWASTKELPEYTNWKPGQPSNLGGHEDCARMYMDSGLWNDDHCVNVQLRSICQAPTLGGGVIG